MARQHRRRQGAKPGPKAEPHEVLFFRAPVALAQELRQHAELKEQKMAAVLRRFVRHGLEAERNDARV